MRYPIALLIAFTMIITIVSIINPLNQVYADSLKSAIKQRIGNYEAEMVTDPKNPVIGEKSRILLRFGSVNGDDLIDVPIVIRIVKDNVALEKTQQILVPYGHYNYDYVFPESGRYIVYVDVNDVAYSRQTLNFIYFIDIGESWNYGSLSLAITIVVVIITVVVSVIFLKRKKDQAIKNTKN
jgi:ABC-type glycerol-3-phosphate transport system permease component